MASEYTANFDLDKYVGTDKPNLRDQYNAAMDKIDAQFLVETNKDTELSNQIYTVSSNLSDVDASVTTIKDDLTAAEGDIDALQSSMTTAEENIDALQSSMTTAEENITTIQGDVSALTATVETHGDQITSAAKTADDALSLAQTNEGDISTLDGEMADVQSSVSQLTTNLVPTITTWESTQYPISGSFCVNEGAHLCTLRVQATAFVPDELEESYFAGFTIPDAYMPTVSFGGLLDVNSADGQVTNVVVHGSDVSDFPGQVRIAQYGGSTVAVTASVIYAWFYGF